MKGQMDQLVEQNMALIRENEELKRKEQEMKIKKSAPTRNVTSQGGSRRITSNAGRMQEPEGIIEEYSNIINKIKIKGAFVARTNGETGRNAGRRVAEFAVGNAITVRGNARSPETATENDDGAK